MKKLILFDDGNKIAQKIEKSAVLQGYIVDVYRGGVNSFVIEDFVKSKSSNYKFYERGKYDAMIIAPMYFEYDYIKSYKANIDLRVFDKMVEINLKFPTILMAMACQLVKKGGAVVNLLSTDYLWGSYISKFYSAIMSAKVSLIKSFGNTLGEKGIRVNGVGAGWVEDIITADSYSPELIEPIKENIPNKRMAKLNEIADVFMYLVSSSSTYINGQVINVDGGYGNVDIVTKAESLLG